MAVLANGIETLEFGVLDWHITLNTNFGLLDSASNIDSLLATKAVSTHNHDAEYEVTATTITQAVLEPVLSELDVDFKFTLNTKGIVVEDTVTLGNVRIYIDNDVVLSEVVV